MLKTIKSRFVAYFGLFSLINAVLLFAMSFVFLLTVEDEYIYQSLFEEADYLETQFELTGSYPEPTQKYFQIYQNKNNLPIPIQNILTKYPNAMEAFGEQGKHYHFTQLTQRNTLLVAEVSNILVARKLREPILLVMTLFTLAIVSIGAILAYFFTRSTLKPLTALNELLQSCEPNNLPKNFAEPYQGSEIGVVAQSLEHALLKIEKYVERETQFTRDASHELRTPLTSIKGACELLQYDKTLSENNQTILSRIQKATNNMHSIIECLLQLAREQSNLQKQATPLKEIVEQCVLNHDDLITKKALSLELSLDESASLYADVQSLNIIIDNLVQNAVRYTSRGVISVKTNDQGFIIQDSGSGFDFEMVTKLGIKTKETKGFGIGLSLVVRLCELNQLEMSVLSDTQGTKIVLSNKNNLQHSER